MSKSDSNLVDKVSSNMVHESEEPPKLLTGQIIDAKNTLQSFAAFPVNSLPDLERGKSGNPPNTLDRNAQIGEEATCNTNDTINIIEAVAVDPMVDAMVVDSSARSNESVFTKRRMACLLITAFVILAVIAIVVGLSISQTREDNPFIDITPTQAPIEVIPSSPTFPPTEVPFEVLNQRVLTEFINNITLSGKNITVNGTSPESKALTWILEDDALWDGISFSMLSSATPSGENFRIVQRYALAVLWFQQIDDKGVFSKKWSTTTGWLENLNECRWYGVTCQRMDLGEYVGFQDVVTELANGHKFPSELGLLTSLQHLDWSDFLLNVEGSIPSSIGKLTALTWLGIYSLYDLTGTIPESIGLCTRLKHFTVSGTYLSGALPDSIGQWTSLTYFGFGSDLFSSDDLDLCCGTLPDSIGNWTDLSSFGLSRTFITGTLPESIGQWTALTSFAMSFGGLDGTLPQSIGGWTNLTYFDIGFQGLSGTLPESIGQWTALTYIDLSENFLTGTLPVSIGQWSQLTSFIFYENAFVGTLPESVGQWSALTFFDMSYSKLTGSLPISIGLWTDLTYFNVQENKLTGTIPLSTVNWTKLHTLDLRLNSLRGTIPDFIGKCVALRELYASSNKLTGSIPASFGNCTLMYIADFSNNSLSGTLPASIGNWEDIAEFYVNSNVLNGTIPQSLGNWSELYSANFSDNDFSGIVPPALCSSETEVEVDCNLNCTCCVQTCP